MIPNARAIIGRLKEVFAVHTAKDLAGLIGVSQSRISALIHQNDIPWKLCARIAIEHGISIDYLILGKNPPPALRPPEKMLLDVFRTLGSDEQARVYQSVAGIAFDRTTAEISHKDTPV